MSRPPSDHRLDSGTWEQVGSLRILVMWMRVHLGGHWWSFVGPDKGNATKPELGFPKAIHRSSWPGAVIPVKTGTVS